MITDYLLALGKNAPFVIMAVLGLAWMAGQLGLQGRVQLAFAFVCGFCIGSAFQIASLGLPADFSAWFYVVITAILMGLLPSGFYEAVKDAAKIRQLKE
jgi:hypothetical protein